MTEQDYELLSRFIDGELDRAQAQALRARLMAEPELRKALDRMRAVNHRVRTAFDVPGANRVPPAIELQVRNRAASARTLHHWGVAVAASLVAVAGLLLAPQWRQKDQHPGDAPASDRPLAQVLETVPSRGSGWDALEDGRRVRPVLSFFNKASNWCREYLLVEDDNAFRGVACRSNGRWQTEVRVATQLSGSQDDYRPAGATDADRVASYVNTYAADIPLSLDREVDLIARHWQ